MVALLGLSLAGLISCKSEAESSQASAKDPAPAASATQVSATQAEENIRKSLMVANENLRIRKIQPSVIPGMYEVQIMGKGIIYMEENGQYFIDGQMLHLDGKKIVNVTDESMTGLRKDLLATVNKDDAIVFSPKGEVKASISVFTDVDCGYCQKLHREVPALNDMGIEVRYLAYPRAGLNSMSYQKIASAWCADDPRKALTALKNREDIAMNVCEGNPVASEYELGQQMGVTGTPAIVLDSGVLIPGYMPAKNLAERIGVTSGS
ncbi:protein-disulfide isomerase DsbC [Teredinibacter turnerae T7901]|uniref:Thiol:disulfide interchange protein n=2 Tax=Teredinibacter turnerae TaxID=2426 RepID=C5BR77_TERTT|nr:protein-disulfide isomerase DsbC [Teredinibacter turnerae T7901]